MDKNFRTTCIVPFYNEGVRLFNVLDEVVRVNNLGQIICVDDGSVQDQSNAILERYPNIELIRLEKNLGKTGAIREGLRKTEGDLILLFDADLRNLNHTEIEKAVDAMSNDETIDMLILRRVNAPFIVNINRGGTLFSGERILKKKDLEEVLNGQVKGWQIESAVNTYMYQRKKKVFWVQMKAY